MTLPPAGTWDVRGVDGPHYTIDSHCANPRCSKFVDDVHHMWRRSRTGGSDHRWVVVDGVLLPNLVGLCRDCHMDVTGGVGGYKAAIRYHADGPLFTWALVVPQTDGALEFDEVGPLDPQPPDANTLAARASGKAHDPVSCPFCGQARRRPPSAGTPRGGRRRKTWPVPVPADEQEEGADTLDALLNDLAPLLGLTPGPSARFYVLVPALYYAQLHRQNFVESIAGVGA